MRNRYVAVRPAAAMLALAGHLFAGGFWLQVGNPDSNAEARRKNAVLTVKATGCHNPESASVSGRAIGRVGGERRSIPLRLEPLSEPGMFALAQQWPKEGKWVIQLVGRNVVDKSTELFTYALIGAGPDGVARHQAKLKIQPFTDADIDAMLAGGETRAAVGK